MQSGLSLLQEGKEYDYNTVGAGNTGSGDQLN